MSETIEVFPWSNISSRSEHPMHGLCSYLGAFPSAMARTFIQSFSSKGDIVFDPFCGRGTTHLEATLCDRIAISSDLNPLAVAITSAKNIKLPKSALVERIRKLQLLYDRLLYLPEAHNQPNEIKICFHHETLAELCYLRRRLKPTKETDVFLKGALLGILHGGERKNGTSMYVSVSMHNSFSMSPGYIEKYVQTNQLQRVYRNVFDALIYKVESLYKQSVPKYRNGLVLSVDAKHISEHPDMKQYVGKVKLIFSSPPYLNIVNYAKQNWIRLWFLQQDILDVHENLDDDHNMIPWLNFMKEVLLDSKKLLTDDGIIAMVIGDVRRSKNNIVSPARELIRMLSQENHFEWIGCLSDNINPEHKVTKIWGDNKGNATNTERIVLFANQQPAYVKKAKEIDDLRFDIKIQSFEKHAKEFSSI